MAGIDRYVPQDIFLIDDTIARNIAFGLLDEKIDPRACAKLVLWRRYLISSKANCLMASIRTLANAVSAFLAGKRQRIGLARALYHRPSLLILDEATSALDVATEAKLLEALRSLTGKLTMVVAAHRLSAVANCDQVIDLASEIPAVAVSAK